MGAASKILHAGIRDIAALDTRQLLAIDIGNRFPISSLTPFEIPRRDLTLCAGDSILSVSNYSFSGVAPQFFFSLSRSSSCSVGIVCGGGSSGPSWFRLPHTT